MRGLGVLLAVVALGAGLWFGLTSRARYAAEPIVPSSVAEPPPSAPLASEPLSGARAEPERVPSTEDHPEERPRRYGSARLTGRALRSDGSLVPGDDVALQFEWRAGNTTASETVPVTSGRFEAEFELPRELERVTLERDGERPIELVLDWRLAAGDLERDLVFPSGCDCELTIVDQRSGVPVSGAEVWFDTLRVRTDEAGWVTLADALAPGGETRVDVHHPDYPMARFHVSCPEIGGRVERELALDPGFVLGGIVVDARGTPQPGITVRFDPGLGGRGGGSSLGRGDEKRTSTDSEGRFTLRGLVAGTDLALGFLRGDAQLADERIALPGDEARRRWVLPDPLPLRVRVLDASGKPVPHRAVWASNGMEARRRGALSDEDGFFAFEIPPGTWRVCAEYGDPPGPNGVRRLQAQECDVTAASEVELRLPPPPTDWRPASFVLRVRDAATGASLAHVGLQGLLLVNGLDNTLGRAQASPDLGTGYVYTCFEGRFEVVLAAEGYEPARREIELRADAEPVPLDVELVPVPR